MTDYLIDNDNDLTISEGDFAVGESTIQHQKCLLLGQKGSYKQFPTTGVGMLDFLNNEDQGEMMREVRLQFSQDGMTVNGLSYKDSKLQIDASYNG